MVCMFAVQTESMQCMQARKQGQQTLSGFVTGAGSVVQPWMAFSEVRGYDASAGFIANSMHLMGQAGVELATQAIAQASTLSCTLFLAECCCYSCMLWCGVSMA